MGRQNSLRDIHKDAVIAKTAKIHKCVYIEGSVKIGENCIIKPFAFIPNGVEIGDNVFIGPNVTFTNDKLPRVGHEWVQYNTTVSNGVAIGAGAIILPGVFIGMDAVIGAGSVVTKSVEAGDVVAGNPAKSIKSLAKCDSPGAILMNEIIPECRYRETFNIEDCTCRRDDSDPRGELFELLDQPIHVNLITIHQGYARGGHSHQYREMFLVVKGAIEFIEPETSRIAHKGEVVLTTAGIPHALYSPDSESAVIEVRDGGIKFEAEPYPPLRSWVEWLKNTPVKERPKCNECGRFHKTGDHVFATGSTGRNVTSWKK